MQQQKTYKVEVYIYSQDEPIEFITNWIYDLKAENINDHRTGDFIQVGNHILRKADIFKVLINETESNEK